MTASLFGPAVLKTIPNATLTAAMAEVAAAEKVVVAAVVMAEGAAVVMVAAAAEATAGEEGAEKVAVAEEAWTSLASFRLQLERHMVTIRIQQISSKDF